MDLVEELEHRVRKLEREFKGMSSKTYQDMFLSLMCARIDNDLATYLPKVKNLQLDLEDMKVLVEDELAAALKNQAEAAPGKNTTGGREKESEEDFGLKLWEMEERLTEMSKAIEFFKREAAESPAAKNKTQFQEMFRRTQDHERELKRLKAALEMAVQPERVEYLEQKLTFAMSDEFIASNNAPLKAELMAELRKAVEMIVNVELQAQLNYATKGDMMLKVHDLEDKINMRVTAADFNEALSQFDDSLKEENQKTYSYVQTVRKYMAAAEDELQKVRDDFKAYDERLLNKAEVEETERLWQNFERYALYEDLKDLYSKTVPEIQRFEDRLIRFALEVEQAQIIVRRFDEVLNEKASRLDLKELTRTLQSYTKGADFQGVTRGLEDRIGQVAEKVDEVERSIDTMGRSVSKDIYSAVRRATSHLVKQDKDA